MGGGTLIKIVFGYILDWGWNGHIFNNIRIYSAGDYSYALLFVQAFFVISLVIACLYKLKVKAHFESAMPSAA